MKCRSHVLPLWKNPAANGPWYQVLSNPVIPVDSRVFTPAAKWMTAIAAITSAIRVGTSTLRARGSVGEGGVAARPAESVLRPPSLRRDRGASFHSHNPDSRRPASRYGTGSNAEASRAAPPPRSAAPARAPRSPDAPAPLELAAAAAGAAPSPPSQAKPTEQRGSPATPSR